MGQCTPLYHVVCRDCTTESLVDSEADAARRAESHAASTDHRVAFARVGTDSKLTPADD